MSQIGIYRSVYTVGEGHCPSQRFWNKIAIAAGNPVFSLWEIQKCSIFGGRGIAPPLQYNCTINENLQLIGHTETTATQVTVVFLHFQSLRQTKA